MPRGEMRRETYGAGGEGEDEEDDPDPEAEVHVEGEDVGGVGAVQARAQPQQPVHDEQQEEEARLPGSAVGSTACPRGFDSVLQFRIRIQLDRYIIGSPGSGSVYYVRIRIQQL